MASRDSVSDTLRMLILGAHPDDAEFHAGGLAAIYRYFGHEVKIVSVTDGRAGHHKVFGPELVKRRREEAAASAAVIGATSEVWDHPDGQLEPTLELRWQIVSELRTFSPDLVLTHRIEDYHPDHRAVAHAVRDASYLVTVPAVVPDVPALSDPPVVAYMVDRFTRPSPFQADVAFDVASHIDTIVSMLSCHESQVFEWLPSNHHREDQLPEGDEERRAWLRGWVESLLQTTADLHRGTLLATYGENEGSKIRFAEALEISEYAAPLDDEKRARLFSFLPESGSN